MESDSDGCQIDSDGCRSEQESPESAIAAESTGGIASPTQSTGGIPSQADSERCQIGSDGCRFADEDPRPGQSPPEVIRPSVLGPPQEPIEPVLPAKRWETLAPTELTQSRRRVKTRG